MSKKKMGLLVMAYGTPYTEDDIEPYYTHIRHGRRPSDELIEDLKSRYKAIGGISPLAEITRAQAEKLTSQLNKIQDDIEFELFIGLKHIHPFIEDAVKDMHNAGITEAISIVLAPHYSTLSIKGYNDRVQKTADKLGGLKIDSVDHWYDEPKFIKYWVQQLQVMFENMPEEDSNNSVVVFSAHSLPEKIVKAGDPYPEQLATTAKLIAVGAGVNEYAVGWQSAGQTPEPWLGPDVQDLTRDLHKEKAYKAFIYCPVGFVAEHLEVLFDNDTECQIVCEEVGAKYYRPAMPNDHDLFIEALGDVVLKRLKK